MTLAVAADACRQSGKVRIVQNILTSNFSVKLIKIVVPTKLMLL